MLIVIAGPTGTGKSELSLRLAERLADRGTPAEIINADSMQLYRGMDIGTAKLSPAERQLVPHHLFDVLEVTETASVAAYQRDARRTVIEVQSRGAVPILVGGTGLYLAAVVQDLNFPVRDHRVRQALEQELEQLGTDALWRRLQAADAAAAAAIDPGNGRKIVRALEVVQLTGRPFSARLPDPTLWQPATQIFLDGDREQLKRRLAMRTEAMWANGLLEEVRHLMGRGIEQGITARRAIGYAQALAVIHGHSDRAHAIAETTRLTQRYVRRQRSWFARYRDLHRLDYADPALVETALSAVRGVALAD